MSEYVSVMNKLNKDDLARACNRLGWNFDGVTIQASGLYRPMKFNEDGTMTVDSMDIKYYDRLLAEVISSRLDLPITKDLNGYTITVEV